jgi:hypothetical protein
MNFFISWALIAFLRRILSSGVDHGFLALIFRSSSVESYFIGRINRFVVLPSSTYSQQVSRLYICTWSHSDTHHSRYESSGRGIGSSQRPLPDNTNTVQDKHPCPQVGFKPTIPASARPQTYALDCAATGIGDRINTEPKLAEGSE